MVNVISFMTYNFRLNIIKVGQNFDFTGWIKGCQSAPKTWEEPMLSNVFTLPGQMLVEAAPQHGTDPFYRFQ